MNSMSMDMPTKGMEEAPFFSENYFTTQNPATRGLRMTYIKILGILSAVLLVYMMGVLSIYWGALYSSPQQAHKLDAWIIVCTIPCSPGTTVDIRDRIAMGA